MNFMEAVKLMKAGKKCTCLITNNTYTIASDDLSDELIRILHDGKKEHSRLDFFHVESKWELFKEPKETLSDNVIDAPSPYYNEEDLKRFVKLIKKDIKRLQKHWYTEGSKRYRDKDYPLVSRDEVLEVIDKRAGGRFK